MSLPKAVSQETASNPEEEIARLRLAMTAVRARLRENLADFNSPVRNAVREADLAIANDVVLTERIEEQVCRRNQIR